MRLTREFILGSRLTVLLPPLLLYDEYTLTKPRKEEWGVCKVCCSRGVVVVEGKNASRAGGVEWVNRGGGRGGGRGGRFGGGGGGVRLKPGLFGSWLLYFSRENPL